MVCFVTKVGYVDELRHQILSKSHSSWYSIHPGETKMYCDLQEVYLLNRMKTNIVQFMAKCLNYQQVKFEHKKLWGFAQENRIPTWKWEDLNMDFTMGLPCTHWLYDSFWVFVDQMIKSDNFLPMKNSFIAEDYSRLYIEEIVKLHEVPLSIISDWGSQIISQF